MPTLKQAAWHEAGHAVVAWYQGFTVTLVSILPDGESLGRSQHTPSADFAIPSDRERENIVAMAGWAAELQSGEASDGPFDAGDLCSVLSRIEEHAPSQVSIELGWAEAEACRIVLANLARVERLANELIRRGELTSASDILKLIEGR